MIDLLAESERQRSTRNTLGRISRFSWISNSQTVHCFPLLLSAFRFPIRSASIDLDAIMPCIVYRVSCILSGGSLRACSSDYNKLVISRQCPLLYVSSSLLLIIPFDHRFCGTRIPICRTHPLLVLRRIFQPRQKPHHILRQSIIRSSRIIHRCK